MITPDQVIRNALLVPDILALVPAARISTERVADSHAYPLILIEDPISHKQCMTLDRSIGPADMRIRVSAFVDQANVAEGKQLYGLILQSVLGIRDPLLSSVVHAMGQKYYNAQAVEFQFYHDFMIIWQGIPWGS